MNIIHVIRRFSLNEWGGAEEACLNLAKEQSAKGHNVTILSTNALDGESYSTVEGVDVYRFNYFYPYLSLNMGQRDKFDLKGGNPISMGLYHYIRTNDVDIIHVHNKGYLLDVCSVLSKVKNIPIFLTLHGGHVDVPSKETAYFKTLYKRSINLGRILEIFFKISAKINELSGVICVGYSEYWNNRKQGVNAKYIPNGINIDSDTNTQEVDIYKYFNIPRSRRIVLNVARIDSQKNQEVIIKSMKYFKDKDIQFVIVGAVTEKSYLNKLKEISIELNVSSHLTIVEGIPKGSPYLEALYNSCEIFILPSRHEPFGIVVLEAWKAKKPVITSEVGGLKRLVTNEEDGIFFDNKSEVSLANNLKKLLNNPELASHLGSSGYQKAISTYRWSSIAEEVLSFYKHETNKLILQR